MPPKSEQNSVLASQVNSFIMQQQQQQQQQTYGDDNMSNNANMVFANNHLSAVNRQPVFNPNSYRNPYDVSFNQYQSDLNAAVQAANHEPRVFDFQDETAKVEAVEDATGGGADDTDDAQHWNHFCQTPSLAEAILETDKYLVNNFTTYIYVTKFLLSYKSYPDTVL